MGAWEHVGISMARRISHVDHGDGEGRWVGRGFGPCGMGPTYTLTDGDDEDVRRRGDLGRTHTPLDKLERDG